MIQDTLRKSTERDCPVNFDCLLATETLLLLFGQLIGKLNMLIAESVLYHMFVFWD
jgi:hypothetical protein